MPKTKKRGSSNYAARHPEDADTSYNSGRPKSSRDRKARKSKAETQNKRTATSRRNRRNGTAHGKHASTK